MLGRWNPDVTAAFSPCMGVVRVCLWRHEKCFWEFLPLQCLGRQGL